jgi:hypothetical protein
MAEEELLSVVSMASLLRGLGKSAERLDERKATS